MIAKALIAALILVSAVSQAQQLLPAPALPVDVTIPVLANNLQFSSGIPADQKTAVIEAVSTLGVLPLDNSDADVQAMAKAMSATDVSASGLQTWMQSRVQYLVENNFDLEAHASFSPATFTYAYPNDLPDSFKQPPTPTQTSPFLLARAPLADQAQPANGQDDPNKKDDGKNEAQVVMANIGTAIYAFGKQNAHLVVMDVPGIGSINMTSPRTGLLEIGPGLFPDLGGHKVQNIALDIFRLGTLFHEARHSDGHGHTMGFMHSICPVGHDYQGVAACDLALNGPYTVGSAVMKSLMNKCNSSKTCDAISAQLLQMIYADQAERVIDAPVGMTPSADAAGKMAWDDAPEGQR